MKTRVIILKEIVPRGWSRPFYRQISRIEYDAKAPRVNKIHQLIKQQGNHYGSIGDDCCYLTHADLLELERDGYVRIEGAIKRTAETTETNL